MRNKTKISKEQEKYYPFVPIKLYSKTKASPLIEAILDSRADAIIIPRVLAENLELENLGLMKQN